MPEAVPVGSPGLAAVAADSIATAAVAVPVVAAAAESIGVLAGLLFLAVVAAAVVLAVVLFAVQSLVAAELGCRLAGSWPDFLQGFGLAAAVLVLLG